MTSQTFSDLNDRLNALKASNAQARSRRMMLLGQIQNRVESLRDNGLDLPVLTADATASELEALHSAVHAAIESDRRQLEEWSAKVSTILDAIESGDLAAARAALAAPASPSAQGTPSSDTPSAQGTPSSDTPSAQGTLSSDTPSAPAAQGTLSSDTPSAPAAQGTPSSDTPSTPSAPASPFKPVLHVTPPVTDDPAKPSFKLTPSSKGATSLDSLFSDERWTLQ